MNLVFFSAKSMQEDLLVEIISAQAEQAMLVELASYP
jgi:hypothetical protein